MDASTDYYDLLECPRAKNRQPRDIKRAYRDCPDSTPTSQPGGSEAEARFKHVAMAYETRCDPRARQRYDRYGPEGAPRAARGFAGAGAILSRPSFGRPIRSSAGVGRPVRRVAPTSSR